MSIGNKHFDKQNPKIVLYIDEISKVQYDSYKNKSKIVCSYYMANSHVWWGDLDDDQNDRKKLENFQKQNMSTYYRWNTGKLAKEIQQKAVQYDGTSTNNKFC